MATYSFLDVNASITGPGGQVTFGQGAGAAEEGFETEPEGDKDEMTIGADGTGMHSLIASNAGTVTLRLLKTSPANAQLMTLYALQSLSSSTWGQNVISITNAQNGDSVTCTGVAFKKRTKNVYASKGGTNEWTFNCVSIIEILGTYTQT